MALPNYDKAIKFADTKYGSIGTIYLTGGGFVNRPFNGIAPDSQWGWEEFTWFKPPTRNRTFAFQNMDNIDVGLIARCEINVKYMNIEDYKDLRKIVGRERYFTATFFDVDAGEWVTRTMYCTENSKKQLFTLKQSLIGVLDLAIKLAGTNTDQEARIVTKEDGTEKEIYVTKKYNITYNANNVELETTSHYYAEQVKLRGVNDIVAPTGNSFYAW